jgi:hypothetical protein
MKAPSTVLGFKAPSTPLGVCCSQFQAHSLYTIIVPRNWFINLMMPKSNG